MTHKDLIARVDIELDKLVKIGKVFECCNTDNDITTSAIETVNSLMHALVSVRSFADYQFSVFKKQRTEFNKGMVLALDNVIQYMILGDISDIDDIDSNEPSVVLGGYVVPKDNYYAYTTSTNSSSVDMAEEYSKGCTDEF